MPDLTHPFFWNGTEFVPSAGIPVTDRGFRYGMALFESLAIRGGRVEFLQEHLDRIGAACVRCGWPVEPRIFARAGEWLQQHPGSVFARIYVTAGDGGPTAPVDSPRVFVFAEPRSAPTLKPCRVTVAPEPFSEVLPGLKTANYWGRLSCLNRAQSLGFDEALLCSASGELISACMANCFVVLDGKLVTPPASSGARPGVVRDWVIRQHGASEQTLTRDDMTRVTECFLTSSWLGVTPAAALDTRPLGTDVGNKLLARFRQH